MTMTDTDVSVARPRRRRRSVSTSNRSRGYRRWLRPLYFGMAAMWGYLSGVAVVAAASRLGGAETSPGSLSPVALIGGAVVAAVGGVISAAAYRQARQRLS